MKLVWLSRTWAVGFWVVILAVCTVNLCTEGVQRMDGRWSSLTALQWTSLIVIVALLAYFEGYRAFQLAFAPILVSRAWCLSAATPMYVHGLAPAFAAGLFDGTRRRLVVSWGLVVLVAALGVATAHSPWPWREWIDFGVTVGLFWGTIAILRSTYLGYCGDLGDVDPQLAPRSELSVPLGT